MMLRVIVTTGLLLASTVGLAQTVQLITPDEAKQPLVAPDETKRALTRGPGIKLASPVRVTGEFAFKVDFQPRGDSKIDVASVKVEYLKGAGFDLTERIKRGIKPTGIDISNAAAPSGEHPIRVTVRDNEGRLAAVVFKLVVK